MSDPTSGQREQLVRAGLAALVVVLVLVMVVLDRRNNEDPEQTSATPGPVPTTPLPGTETGTPLDSSTPVPVPVPGDRDRPGRRKGDGQAVPAPPEGLEQLVCEQLSQPVDLVVLSFNIHHGNAGLERVAQAIARARADVVLMQEVVRHGGARGGDQTAALAERLTMHGVFGANLRRGGNLHGTAILSRHEILQWRNTPLPGGAGSYPRGLLHAVVEIEGRGVSLYTTHLEPGATALRTRQAAAAARIMAGDPRPKVLGGDLNTWPGSRPMTVLRGQVTDTWPLVGVGPAGTGPRGGRIDYVMASGDFLARHSTVLPSVPSDHNAVRTELVLPATPCADG